MRVTVWSDDGAGGTVPGAFHWAAPLSTAPGRGLVTVTKAAQAGSAAIATVPGGRTAYLVHLVWTLANSGAALADVRLRDGAAGADNIPVLVPAGGFLAVSEQMAEEPHQFTSALYVAVLSGTVTWSAHACGYLV